MSINYSVLPRSIWPAVILVVGVLSAMSGIASEPEKTESIMTVSFAELVGETPHMPETVTVVLDAAGCDISAFDLKFGFNSDNLSIVAVLPGELADSCDWKVFEARPIVNDANRSDGDQLWQAIGLAELIPDSTGPVCYTLNRPVTLATIILSRNSTRAPFNSRTDLYFYWEDCGDNSVADRSGNTLYLSRRVTGLSGDQSNRDDFMTGTFPTRKGAPEKCSRRKSVNRPERRIDFVNLRLVTGSDSGGAAGE